MIKIYAGENIVLSRKAFLDEIEGLKNKKVELISFEGKRLTLSELILATESKSLFKQDKAIVIENLLSSLKSKEKDKIINYLASTNNDFPDVLIWEPKEIAKSVSLNKNWQIKLFKLSSFLFNFLDQLKPGSAAKNITNFHQCLKSEPAEMVFSMIIRQFRLLILAKDNDRYLNKMAPWQKSKLLSQAKLFSQLDLKQNYRRLLEIDFRQKTSGTPFDLSSELDLFLSDL